MIESPVEHCNSKNKYYKGTPLLLILQIIVCLIILSLAFLLKNYGGTIYEKVGLWYNKNLNDSLILEDDIEQYKESINAMININTDFIKYKN